jgi:general secretion pathway protein D
MTRTRFFMLGAVSTSALIMVMPTHLAARPSPASTRPAPPQTRDGFTLAFVDADVKRVVDAILGSMLAVDYSVDPAVTGNITLRTSQSVSRAQLLPLLEGALKSVGAAVLIDGRSYRVVPLADARTRAPVTSAPLGVTNSGPLSPGYSSEVFTLRHGSAREIGKMLQQFLGKDAVAGTDNALNQVTVAGTAEERQAARDLVKRFDVDTLADMNFELYRLENVDAASLLAELERIFQPPYDIIGSRVRIVPLPRLRSVLAIAADRGDLARIEPWIHRLDVGVSGKRKLYSYAVQNGRAKDLASALQQVLGNSGANASSTAPVQSNDNSSGPLSGLGGGSFMPDAAAQRGGGQSATPLASSVQPAQGASSGGVRIVPNESTNSLLIYADGEEYEFVKEAIQKLDMPVAQVLIEATLAEVTLSDDLRYGINFRGISGLTTFANSATGGSIPASTFPGFSVSVVGTSVSGVLNTLQSKTNVRVLSAPKIVVLNNQTATLQVGDQVPIITQQQQSVASPGAPVVNTIEMRDTGVILKVTPRVNDSGAVTLDIDQEVSDVAQTTTSGINSPTIQQRRLSSTVVTRTGQMIALGGLIRDRTSRTRSGIPFLSQIPVIGGAFGNHGTTGGRTELIILLTPTVIRSPDEVKGVVDALINGLDAARPLVERAKAKQVGGHPIAPVPIGAFPVPPPFPAK